MAIAFTFGADAAASGSSTTITRTATFGAGETISVYIQMASVAQTVSTVTDGTNTYNFVARKAESVLDTRTMEHWEAHNVAAGSPTITVTFTGSVTNRGVGYCRGTGADTSVGAQTGVGNFQTNPGTGTDAVTTTNMTPTSQPNGVLAYAATYVNARTVTQGTGYTSLGVLTAWNALLGDTSRIEFKRTTSTSAVAGTFTINGTENIMTIGGVFTEAAAGGGAIPRNVFGKMLSGCFGGAI